MEPSLAASKTAEILLESETFRDGRVSKQELKKLITSNQELKTILQANGRFPWSKFWAAMDTDQSNCISVTAVSKYAEKLHSAEDSHKENSKPTYANVASSSAERNKQAKTKSSTSNARKVSSNGTSTEFVRFPSVPDSSMPGVFAYNRFVLAVTTVVALSVIVRYRISS